MLQAKLFKTFESHSESAILDFFLLHPHENQSKLLGYQEWVKISMIVLIYSKRVSVPNNMLYSKMKKNYQFENENFF